MENRFFEVLVVDPTCEHADCTEDAVRNEPLECATGRSNPWWQRGEDQSPSIEKGTSR